MSMYSYAQDLNLNTQQPPNHFFCWVENLQLEGPLSTRILVRQSEWSNEQTKREEILNWKKNEWKQLKSFL